MRNGVEDILEDGTEITDVKSVIGNGAICTTVIPHLPRFVNLTVLCLNSAGLCDWSFLPCLPRLEILSLANNHLRDGLCVLAERGLLALQSLNLSGNDVCDFNELRSLCPLRRLRHLDLRFTDVRGTPDFARLVRALMPWVKRVDSCGLDEWRREKRKKERRMKKKMEKQQQQLLLQKDDQEIMGKKNMRSEDEGDFDDEYEDDDGVDGDYDDDNDGMMDEGLVLGTQDYRNEEDQKKWDENTKRRKVQDEDEGQAQKNVVEEELKKKQEQDQDKQKQEEQDDEDEDEEEDSSYEEEESSTASSSSSDSSQVDEDHDDVDMRGLREREDDNDDVDDRPLKKPMNL